MLIMRDIMSVDEISQFNLVPCWDGSKETLYENVDTIALEAVFANGNCDGIGYVNMNAFESSEEAWEYAKELVCILFDDGKLDLVSEAIKGFVLLD